MDIPITLQLGATTQVVALVAVAGPVRTSYHCCYPVKRSLFLRRYFIPWANKLLLSGEAIAISTTLSTALFHSVGK